MAIGPLVPPLTVAENRLPDNQSPDNATLAINFYNTARAEILARLNMRETTFLAWITVVGAILSFAARSSPGILFEPRHLQLIPPLCLPFSLAIYRHSLIIGHLGEYIRTELGGPLRQAENPKNRDTQNAPRHWDVSDTLSKRIRGFLAIEGIAYTFFLAGVPAFCLFYVHWFAPLPWSNLWLRGGTLCTVFVALVGLSQVAREYLKPGNLAK